MGLHDRPFAGGIVVKATTEEIVEHFKKKEK